ncbi:UDP-glycosyltransferase 90A1-like [Phragmites australis]|uniref:UDP-glycosyltransferase 90A1-like n=1 Tax=Phragmites australis TaxID=29695 RepID=UPI002D778AF9|nr:UDP-glycosyltransferase 90A1-like [Phragmites australis]
MAVVSSSPETHARPHKAIFPFMAKGHTIPLIHLAHHLRRHGNAAVTFITTPGNAVFVREGLSGADAAVVELAFPADVPGILPGVESAEGLTSMSSFAIFAEATSLLKPQLEASLARMQPPASLLVADPFLYWTNASAARLGVPKVSFFGISAFAQVMRELRVRHDPCATLRHGDVDADGNPATFTMPEFPHIKLTFEDFMAPFGDPASIGPMLELDGKLGKAIEESQGLIINTFHGLETPYVEFWNQHVGPKAWPVGPLCLSQPASAPSDAPPSWMVWLDDKAAAGRAVLYVALGTLAAISESQLKEVADGLERADVDFVWAVRPENVDLGQGFEERTKGRGLVVREWVEQLEILKHGSVRGFLSHCGWNSVLESVAAGVPLAVWPMHADQPFNAKFIVDELKIAVRVQTSDGTIRGLVTSEEVSKVVTALMLGEEGLEAAKNVAELSALAKEAMAEGGSSWKAVENMISELCVTSLHGKVEASQEQKVDL